MATDKKPRFVELGVVKHKATITINGNPLTYVGLEEGECDAIRVAANDEKTDGKFSLVFVPKEENPSK